MRIAILGAMREEIEPLLPKVENLKKEEYANNIFYTGTLSGKEIALAYSKIGKVNAALTATLLIEKYGCKKLLFSGVAGGINESLKIGDLIVADKLVQHDVDITVFGHAWGFIPESGDFVESDKELNEIASKVAEKLGIKLIRGTIATGDQFIASEEKKEWIKNIYKADALEMEGASVGYVCKCLGVPFFVLRAISDTADMDAGFSFEEFLVSSAKVSANFLENILFEL